MLVEVTSWPVKVNPVEGESVTVGVPAVPVPLRTNICGLLVALSVKVSAIGPRAPAALGVKVILIMHDAPGAIVRPLVQVVPVAMANSVVVARLGAAVSIRLALPVFSMVTVCAALGAPMSCPAKVRVTGPGEIAPKRPSCSPLIPAVKYRVVGLLPVFPLPNTMSQRPGFAIGLPSESAIVPRKVPATGSNALMRPSPKLPTSKSPAKVMNPEGAIVIPQGALRGPLETSRFTKLPFKSKILTKPNPAPVAAPRVPTWANAT